MTEKRWVVRHREGTCAVAGNRKPAEGSNNVPTVCGWFIVLPGGYSRDVPTCAECLAVLAKPGHLDTISTAHLESQIADGEEGARELLETETKEPTNGN